MPNDRLIHDTIVKRFASDLSDASRIALQVQNGAVTLSGEVGRYSDKCAANDAVKTIIGVTSLIDDLKIVIDGPAQNDETLQKAAEHALDTNVFIPSTRISVAADGGRVTLSGTVLYYREKIDAENAIRRLPGLKAITNNIEVSNSEAPHDMSEPIIADAISNISGIEFDAINVQVEGDKALLQGSVRTLAERDDVERAAWSAPGILHVQNDIKVQA